MDELCGSYQCHFASTGECAGAGEIARQHASHQRLIERFGAEKVKNSWQSYRQRTGTLLAECKYPEALQEALDETKTL